MTSSYTNLLVFSLLVLFAQPVWGVQPPLTVPAVRQQVLKAATPESKGASYKKLFLLVGPRGVKDLVEDADVSVSLQAAWEQHKRVTQRPQPILGRTNSVYDPKGLTAFLSVLKDRTKAPVPDWWKALLLDVDVFPGEHHAFPMNAHKNGPKRETSKAGIDVPKGAELESKGDFIYTVAGRSIKLPKATFDEFGDCWGSVATEKLVVIASYQSSGGFQAELAAFEGRGGKPTWKAEIWATDRAALGGFADHRLELREKGGTVFVFGAESHGAYLEAFDLKSGKCLYRFCSCYWSNHSESWTPKK